MATSRILGVSAYYHDAAATLIIDGQLVAAAQEERFTRKKGDPRFPTSAIAFCLEQGGISVDELDHVAFYEKPLVKLERLLHTFLRHGWDARPAYTDALPRWATGRLHLRDDISRALGETFTGQLVFADHHESHAASAYFPSPFDRAAIVTLDAVGEWATTTVGVGRGNRIELIEELRFPHSLGMLYSAFTTFTGFKVNSGEYKLMGLAPYGAPRYESAIREHLVDIADDGSLLLNMRYFQYEQGLTMTAPAFAELFDGPPRAPESTITQREMDLAASVQVVCEDVVQRVACHAREVTGESDLVMAGGVALNCVANGKLRRQQVFDDIWVQPAAGDAGGSLGAALLTWHHLLDAPRTPSAPDGQQGSFLGPDFDPIDIETFLDAAGAAYRHIDDEEQLLELIADTLASGQVIGWFHGRMEFGPRSLGARSIIGDARSTSMQQTMNLKIKFRESFRPFAPVVLREHAHEYFEVAEGQDDPYMLFVSPVRAEHRTDLDDAAREQMQDPDLRVRVSVPRSSLPAITHVDYSARVQTIDEHRHGRFYRLVERFREKTGCPVIVNTSFNIRGEPIVRSPEEAWNCFTATDIDCLVLEDHVLFKDDQPPDLLRDAEAYKAQYALD